MKGFHLPTLHLAATIACVTLTAALSPTAAAADAPAKTRVLLVYGGHDFETNQFLKLFRDNSSITLQTAEHPKAHGWFKPERARDYDVLVFYDMWQTISEEAKGDLLNLVKSGKPLVALHHSLGSYQKWDEYSNLVGGKYHLEKWMENGVSKPGSTYKHDVQFRVHIADREHPITRGISDFDIHDETYGRLEVKPQAHVLLTTTEPTSHRDIAWTKSFGAGRVVYIQLGHDHLAYENPNYRKLVTQAIQWAVQRD